MIDKSSVQLSVFLVLNKGSVVALYNQYILSHFLLSCPCMHPRFWGEGAWGIKLKCAERTNNERVALAAVADVATTESHVPNAVGVVLGGTPMVRP